MRVALAGVVAALLAACSGEERASGPQTPPMAEAERARGRTACERYVARLCACAAARPASADLAGRCRLKKMKTEALDQLLALDDDPAVDAVDRAHTQRAARDVIAKCLEENLALDAENCPP